MIQSLFHAALPLWARLAAVAGGPLREGLPVVICPGLAMSARRLIFAASCLSRFTSWAFWRACSSRVDLLRVRRHTPRHSFASSQCAAGSVRILTVPPTPTATSAIPCPSSVRSATSDHCHTGRDHTLANSEWSVLMRDLFNSLYI